MKYRVALSALLLTLLAVGPTGAVESARPGKALSPEVLQALLKHYQREKSLLGNPRYVALVDYRRNSREPRFYVIEPGSRRVVAKYRVAHGRGSDSDHDGYAEAFSDEAGSLMSSIGLFRTGEAYLSESDGHGLSLRLDGLSATNRSARDRNIVIHANYYMEAGFVDAHGLPGRSHGCLVFSAADRDEVVALLRGGALIHAVH